MLGDSREQQAKEMEMYLHNKRQENPQGPWAAAAAARRKEEEQWRRGWGIDN
jgi:hypothetical protein